MRFRIVLLITPLLLITAITGCASAKHHLGGPDGSYALGVVWHRRIYDMNPGIIQATNNPVGKQLGRVTQFVKRPLSANETGIVSNEFPVGSKVYEVSGQSPKKAIAVENQQGRYEQFEALHK